VAFIVLIVLSVQFIWAFFLNGLDFSNVSLWGDDWSQLFGVVLFNFIVVIAVPAWLYERKPTVNVSTALNYSSGIGFVLYILVGGLGALTMPNVADDMVQSMMSGSFGQVTEVCSMVFTIFIVGLSIPLFSVLIRLNLTGSGLCSERMANVLAVYLPWGTSWMFYVGGNTSALLGWGGILFSSFIVFLAPLSLALQVLLESDAVGSIDVYGGFFKSRSAQKVMLCILLACSVVSITLAVIGELLKSK